MHSERLPRQDRIARSARLIIFMFLLRVMTRSLLAEFIHYQIALLVYRFNILLLGLRL